MSPSVEAEAREATIEGPSADQIVDEAAPDQAAAACLPAA